MSATPRLDAVAKALAVGAPPSPNYSDGTASLEGEHASTYEGEEGEHHPLPHGPGFVVTGIHVSEEHRGKGHAQRAYMDAMRKHGRTYHPWPISADADRAHQALERKGMATISHTHGPDGTWFRVMRPTQTDKAAKPPMPEPMKKAHDPEHAMAARFLTQSKLREAVNHTHTLAMKTQRFHWNVDGPDFPALHKLFGDQYDELGDAVDELAERYKAIGPGEIRAVEIPSFDDPKSATAMCSILATDHAACAMICNALARRAEAAGDAGTVDLAGRRAAAHEKAAWMLRATARPEEKPTARATTIIVAKRPGGAK